MIERIRDGINLKNELNEEEYQDYIQNVPPESLIKSIRNFQRMRVMFTNAKWIGGSIAFSPIPISGILRAFDIRISQDAEVAGVYVYFAGVVTWLLSSHGERDSKNQIEPIFSEVQRRLSKTSQVTEE